MRLAYLILLLNIWYRYLRNKMGTLKMSELQRIHELSIHPYGLLNPRRKK